MLKILRILSVFALLLHCCYGRELDSIYIDDVESDEATSQIVSAMLERGFILEEETNHRLVFSKESSLLGQVIAGAILAAFMNDPHITPPHIEVVMTVSTDVGRVRAGCSVAAVSRNRYGQRISADLNGKVADYMSQMLREIKSDLQGVGVNPSSKYGIDSETPLQAAPALPKIPATNAAELKVFYSPSEWSQLNPYIVIAGILDSRIPINEDELESRILRQAASLGAEAVIFCPERKYVQKLLPGSDRKWRFAVHAIRFQRFALGLTFLPRSGYMPYIIDKVGSREWNSTGELRSGDEIVLVDGQLIREEAMWRPRSLTWSAETLVHVQIKRGGKTIELDVPVISADRYKELEPVPTIKRKKRPKLEDE